MDPKKLEEIRNLTNDTDETGKDELTLCFDIMFFYRGGFPERHKEILNFYNRILDFLKGSETHYLIDMEGRFKKAKADTLEILPFWADAPTVDRGVYGLIVETADKSAAFSDRAFQTHNVTEHSGWTRLVLPIELFFKEGADFWVKLALELGGQLDFSSGSAGYALNQHLQYSSAMENGKVHVTSRRFIGVDVAAPADFDRFVPCVNLAGQDWLKTVNWLTFLGNSLLKRAGGEKTLRRRLSEAIIIHPMPNGIMIQAGKEPTFGDVNSGDSAPLYREVGRVLSELIIPASVMSPWNSIGGTENTANWIHRFGSTER